MGSGVEGGAGGGGGGACWSAWYRCVHKALGEHILNSVLDILKTDTLFTVFS